MAGHLGENFVIKLMVACEELKYTQFIFPGGEISVRIDPKYDGLKNVIVDIIAKLQSPMEIMELLLLTDAVRRMFSNVRINLNLPYVPYARQDRVSVPGEALSIKVFADLINSQRYNDVEVWDPHSDVTVALLNNCTIVSQAEIVRHLPLNWEEVTLVAPDVGAGKKIYSLAKEVESSVITASKVRDPFTGTITRTKIAPDQVISFNSKRLLIVDDICDGGRTFIELAKALRKETDLPIDLYVTHGIFSKGLHVFDGLIEDIYCANPWVQSERIIEV